MVVMRHEGRDLAFEVAGQVVGLKQDAVLERLMPALDFALGLRVIGGAADMLHLLAIQLARDPSRRTTRRYPTTSAAGERRSSDRARRPPTPDRAWR
jgi:hypothetical protein